MVTYKQWVESHTPDQIRLANIARRALRKKGFQGRKGFGRLDIIEDSRMPTRNRNSFVYFIQDRQASGDFKGLRSADAVKLLGKEWAGMSADQQKASIISRKSCPKLTMNRFTGIKLNQIRHDTNKSTKPCIAMIVRLPLLRSNSMPISIQTKYIPPV